MEEEPAASSAAARSAGRSWKGKFTVSEGSGGWFPVGPEEPAVASAAARATASKSQVKRGSWGRVGLEEPAVTSAAARAAGSKPQVKPTVVSRAFTLGSGWSTVSVRRPIRPSSAGRGRRRQEKIAAAYQGWALLDSSVVLETTTANSTGLALCKSSNDRDVRVSLHLAKPPSTSYVHMNTDADLYDKPTVVAADGDLFLMHMVIAVRDPPPTSYQDNFFVYKAHPSMGWLRRLPEFGEWGAQARYAGITRRGSKDDFVVAAFRTNIVGGADWGEGGGDDCEEVAQLSRYSSSRKQWEMIELPIPYDPQKGLYQFVWYSDDHFAFDGDLFWVDYHRGILFCDAFAQQPFLQFIQLPEISIWDQDHDYTEGRQLPRAYRTVGVCRGEVKFVDIDDGLFGTRKKSGFTITTWNLKKDELAWSKETVLQVDDLWSFPRFRESPLPRWVPEFPVVSKQDPGIFHFILREARSDAKAWVITLDLRNMEIESYMPFINEYNPVYEDSDLDTKSIFFNTPFICCDFDFLDTQTGSDLGTVEPKRKKSLQSDFSDDNSDDDISDEESDSDDDDDDDDMSDEYDSDANAREHCQNFTRDFFEILGKLSVEETNQPNRMWHCPACKGGPGASKWYTGTPALMDHAQAEQLERVNLHKTFAALLKEELSRKINLLTHSDEQFDKPPTR